jgi:hypothetical protein
MQAVVDVSPVAHGDHQDLHPVFDHAVDDAEVPGPP